jgi:hypothetical protein
MQFSDHDGRAWERPDGSPLDEANTQVDGDGILLPRWLRSRL